MLYLSLMKRLENIVVEDADLRDCTVNCNRINGVSFLFVKTPEDRIAEVIVFDQGKTKSDLNDEIYEQLKKTEKNYKSLLEENEQLKQQLKDCKNR